MNQLIKYLTGPAKALCLAALTVCSLPSWSMVPTRYTHIEKMNEFTIWYEDVFRGAARKIAANELKIVSKSTKDLHGYDYHFSDAWESLTPTQQQELNATIRRQIDIASLTARWGPKFLVFSSMGFTFTDKELNELNQLYRPNLDNYLSFAWKVNPTKYNLLKAKIAELEEIDDRKLTPGRNLSDGSAGKLTLDGYEIDENDNVIFKLGTYRKRVERAELFDERKNPIVSFFFGPKYSRESRIAHGPTFRDLVAKNSYEFGSSSTNLQVKNHLRGSYAYSTIQKSERFANDHSNGSSTIDYYVNEDIAQNGSFAGMTIEQSKRALRDAAMGATREVGDPYFAYAMAQYAIRVSSLFTLATIRNELRTKVINFSSFGDTFNQAIWADEVIRSALEQKNTEMNRRIVNGSYWLLSMAVGNWITNSVTYWTALKTVRENPDLTLKEQQELASIQHRNIMTSSAALITQLGALGLYNIPGSLTPVMNPESYRFLKENFKYYIPFGFAMSDTVSAIHTLVAAFRQNPYADPGEVLVSNMLNTCAACTRLVGAGWSFMELTSRFFNWYLIKRNPENQGPVWPAPEAQIFTYYTPIQVSTAATRYALILTVASWFAYGYEQGDSWLY